jgi:DNA-binding MarR family transcriptional regulator
MQNLQPPDFFAAIGSLGIASRLKRLSDRLMAETRAVYRAAGVEFEPRWFPVFFLLQQHRKITVMDVAAHIGVPHTYVSQLIKEMRAEALVQFEQNPDDGRSRLVALTPKGMALADTLQPLWSDIRTAVDTIIHSTGTDVLGTIERMERLLTEAPMSAMVRAQWEMRVP